MTTAQTNPFQQSPQYWRVTFMIHADAAGTAEEAFNDVALAVSGFETDEANHIWTFELLCGEAPDMEDMKRRLMLLASLHSVPEPVPSLQKVEQVDWLAQVARSFPPLSIGRFYVYGSHVEEPPPTGSIPIQVDAGAAFGSGEHGTTRCCLEALDWLSRKSAFTKILDMGCGSGILAIAAAKLWKVDVLAVDIDPVAVRVTEDNVRINRETTRVVAAVSDGYQADKIKKGGPFQLIVSNILARPLIAFAPDLFKNLAPGGYAVLSGLLTSQEQQVLSAHVMQGLKMEKRFVHDEWCTLVLKKR
ncbi:MAG: 50S ribosomal protein L11 methyltransferase [Rickettsiales bacterium]|nr:50S ribosomal protein L11 methyltransferase [Rickettsiales bacterium]